MKYLLLIGALLAAALLPATASDSGLTMCEAEIVPVADIDCISSCTGELTAVMTGGVSPFTYAWSNGEVGDTIRSLCAFIYSVTVTDAENCEASATFDLRAAIQLEATLSVDNASCSDTDDGAISVEATGGTPDYTYEWSNGSTAAAISNLEAGTYTVTITENSGCAIVLTQEITSPPPLVIDFTTTDALCFGNCDGSIDLRVNGGTAPFIYNWSIGVPSQDLIDICAGTYSVTVTDSEGCAIEGSFTITEPVSMSLTITDQQDATCPDAFDGSLTVGVTGGTPDYTFLWSNGVTTQTATNLSAGTYTVTVTDANGCEAQVSGTVGGFPDIEVDAEVTGLTCNGGCDGTITLTARDGDRVYNYQWGDGNTSRELTGLCAGTYEVLIVDEETGCTLSLSIVVSEPDPISGTLLVLDAACSEDGLYEVQAFVVTGGTPPYTYSWPEGDLSIPGTRFASLPENAVTITDAAECMDVSTEINFQNTVNSGAQPVQYLQDCADLMLPVPVVPENFGVVWTAPDGVSFADLATVVTLPGRYTFEASPADGACTYTGFVDVIDARLAGLTLSNVLPGNCDDLACLRLEGIPEDLLENSALEINWYGPDGPLVTEEVTNELCGLDGAGTYRAEVVFGCAVSNVTVDLRELGLCSAVRGTVRLDSLNNCVVDENDPVLGDRLVEITQVASGRVYYAVVDGFGNYQIELPPAMYGLRLLDFQGRVVPDCGPVTVTTTADATVTADLLQQFREDCTELSVSIQMFRLRRCFSNCIFVNFSNDGDELVEGATVTVDMDPFFDYTRANFPLLDTDGTEYTFDVGDLEAGQRGRIIIYFVVSCDSELGQNHCVNANISPNGFCGGPNNWNGALVSIEDAFCQDDSLRIVLANIGERAMTQPLGYVVVEDGIMMTPEPVRSQILDAGASMTVTWPTEGTTVQVVAEQEANAPVENPPSVITLGCGENADAFTLGSFANLLPLGNGVPWEATVCRENIGSYDPNDKFGFPLGYSGGQIEPGTRLDYRIRFQNTGTDTAFTVVVRDTLPLALDLSTLRLKGASHDFTASLDTNRVLTFRFENILLPDSNTNLLLSQGVLGFSIEHDTLLERGDLIDNRAAIYFDFNEPVITNLSRHMIALEQLPTSILSPGLDLLPVSVYPNPVGADRLQIELPEDKMYRSDFVSIVDLQGRTLLSRTYGQLDGGMNVAALPAGYYLIVLTDAVGRVKGRTGFVRR